MNVSTWNGRLVKARIGFAADREGHGVAYARVCAGRTGHLLRVSFKVNRHPAMCDREVGYAALTAAARHLHDRGVRRVRFAVPDRALVEDLKGRREVPIPLALAYVRLGCALNKFARFDLDDAADDDLSARARAEVALHVAA